MAVSGVHPPTEQPQGRIARANALFTERLDEFRYDRALRLWFVPSATIEGRTYAVRLKPVERCACRAFGYQEGPCKHILSLKLFKAKTTVGSSCGGRVLWGFVTEVREDDELLCWFEGDRICADCIADGVWA